MPCYLWAVPRTVTKPRPHHRRKRTRKCCFTIGSDDAFPTPCGSRMRSSRAAGPCERARPTRQLRVAAHGGGREGTPGRRIEVRTAPAGRRVPLRPSTPPAWAPPWPPGHRESAPGSRSGSAESWPRSRTACARPRGRWRPGSPGSANRSNNCSGKAACAQELFAISRTATCVCPATVHRERHVRSTRRG